MAGEPIFESNGVTLEYDKDKDVYEVKKDGKLDSRRMIQSYKDIPKMKELLEKLGADVDKEIVLTLNNNLMKTLEPPTVEQALEVGVKNFEEISLTATSQTELSNSCPLFGEGQPPRHSPLPSIGESKKKGWFCAAPTEKELSPDWNAAEEIAKANETRTFTQRWLGDKVKHRVTVDTYNDNFLHGGGIALFGEQKADDRARTYGHGIQYDAEGQDGSFQIRYQSTLFGREVTRPNRFGYQTYLNEDGEKYLEAMEETTLTLRGTKNFQDDDSTYGIGSLSFRERTDENRGSQGLQNMWHEMSGSVIYDYQDFMDEEYSLEAKAGIGKKFEGDLGKWKCRAQVEGLVGVDLWTMDRAEAEFNLALGLDSGSWGGREKENPWIAIDAYTRQSYDTDEVYEGMYGTKVSTSFKWGKSTIRPYLGLEYYDEESDRMFQTESEGNELIHTVGVEIGF